MYISAPRNFTGNPRRIVSLVPSQTELLFDLGLSEEVIGITKFCIHPGVWFKEKERIGGTKTINIEKVISLKPDLIIANKEENTKEQIDALAALFPVYVSEVSGYTAALNMIRDIGMLTGKQATAEKKVIEIEKKFDSLKFANELPAAAYVIWKDPYMVAGGDTFISDMMAKAGFRNIFAGRIRYPEITIDGLKTFSPEVILLSSEPYPFTQKHVDALQQDFPLVKILPANGEMFSWYGSRMLHAPAYFKKLRNACRGTAL